MSDKEVQNAIELANAKQRELETAEKLADVYKNMGDSADSILNAAEHAKLAQDAQLDTLQKRVEAAEAEKRAIQQQIADGILVGEAAEKALAAVEKKVIEQRKSLDLENELIKKAKELADEYEQGIQRAEKAGASLASKLFGADDKWKDTWWGNLASGDFTEKLSAMKKGFASALEPANILGGLMMKVQESTLVAAMRFDNVSSQLAASTGQGMRYNDMIMTVAEETRSFGVGIQEAGSAIQGLNESMSGFSQASSEVQTSLVKQAAILERLGVSAQTTGRITDQLTKGMGMSADQAMQTNNELARAAMGIGVPVGKMAQEFENAMPALASYGKEAPKIFKKVMAAAKGLGVEINTLLGFTQQFDTFEGAATAVGKLNNILGGDLFNTYEMINASEEERIELMLRNLELSGKNFNSMNRFEKMALANAAGIQDMAEANKIFGGGLAAYQQAQRDVEANAVSQKELEERTQAAVSVQEKMNQLFESFAMLVQPIVEGLHSFFNVILSVNDALGGMLAPALLAIAGVYKLMSLGQAKKIAADQAEMAAIIQKANLIKAQKVLAEQEAAQKAASTLQTKVSTVAETESTVAKNLNTGATVGNTSSTTANTAAKNMGILASLRMAAATAANTAKTFLLTIAEKAAAGVRFLLAKASGVAAFMMGKQAVAQSAVTATAAPAAGGLAALAAGMAALGSPPAIFAMAAIAGVAVGLGMIAMGVALAISSIVSLVKLFAEMPELIAPVSFGMLGFLAAMTAVVLGVTMLSPLAGIFLASAVSISAGMMALAPGLIAFSLGLTALGGAMQLIGGGELAAMLGLALIIVPFGLAMVAGAGFIASAAPIMTAGLIQLGIGFSALGVGLTIMTFGIPSMLALIPLLPLFATSLLYSAAQMAVAGPLIGIAGVTLGYGFAALGVGLAILTLGLPSMLLVSGILPLFAAALMASAPAFVLAAPIIGLSAGILGFGLAQLGLGLMVATLGIPSMFLMTLALPMFSQALLLSAPYLLLAAGLIAPAAASLGMSFAVLGAGLALATFGVPAMFGLALALPLFALALMFAAPLMLLAALTFAPAAILIGLGLGMIGMSLLLFDKETVKIMGAMMTALPAFALGLVAMSLVLGLAAATFVPPALALGLALGTFGLALLLFDRKTVRVMAKLPLALIAFSIGLSVASIFLSAAAVGIMLPSLALAAALGAFGLALKLFNSKTIKAMEAVSLFIIPFALSMVVAGAIMSVAGVGLLAGATATSVGLTLLGLAFRTFPDNFAQIMDALTTSIVPFSMAIGVAGFNMLTGGALFGLGALLLAPGLAALSGPLSDFADSVAKLAPVVGQIPGIVNSLALMGPSLVAFAFSMIAFGLAASLPFFDTGLESFSQSIGSLAESLGAVPLEKTTAVAEFFKGLASLSNIETVASVMDEIALGIIGISAALAFLPEEKTVALSQLMTSVTEASVKVTPEGVEGVKNLVEQASAYANVQAEFKAPSVDAFVQALKQVNGEAAAASSNSSGSSSGRDVVLELNGRELGRAIDAHLEDKHNLRTN